MAERNAILLSNYSSHRNKYIFKNTQKKQYIENCNNLFYEFSPCGSAGKESTCSMVDLHSIPRLGISLGEGKGYPLQHPGLENSMPCIYSLWGYKELDMTFQLDFLSKRVTFTSLSSSSIIICSSQ